MEERNQAPWSICEQEDRKRFQRDRT